MHICEPCTEIEGTWGYVEKICLHLCNDEIKYCVQT